MSDKERLEEIKSRYLVGIHTTFGTPWVSMPKENADWLIQQTEKVERYEKAIKECVERMNEGGAGTRSFIYKKLKEVMGRTE